MGGHRNKNMGEHSRSQLDKNGSHMKPKPAVTKTPFIRLIDKEVAKKKARNECFRCNEKFHPGHRCKQGKFHRIELIPHIESPSSGDEAEEDDCAPEEHPHYLCSCLDWST